MPFAQLEVVELQLNQMEGSVSEQLELLTKVSTIQAIASRWLLEQQQLRIRQKAFFCSLIHDKIRQLRRAQLSQVGSRTLPRCDTCVKPASD